MRSANRSFDTAVTESEREPWETVESHRDLVQVSPLSSAVDTIRTDLEFKTEAELVLGIDAFGEVKQLLRGRQRSIGICELEEVFFQSLRSRIQRLHLRESERQCTLCLGK